MRSWLLAQVRRINVVRLQARPVLLNNPNERLARLTLGELSVVDLIREQTAVPPGNVKPLGAHLSRVAHLLMDHLKELKLIAPGTGAAKVVGSIAVDGHKVASIELLVKLLDRG